LTDLGGKTCIFSHPVYLFLREFSLQDSRGGSPHTSHLTPHNSGSGQKAALDVDYRMVWAFSGMVTGK
ncbi:hypothetical protein ACIU3B_004981, partial [Escherichia coli]